MQDSDQYQSNADWALIRQAAGAVLHPAPQGFLPAAAGGGLDTLIVDIEDWVLPLQELAERLIKRYLDVGIVNLVEDLAEGDHCIVGLEYFQFSDRIAYIMKQWKITKVYKVLFLTLGRSLGRSLLTALQAEANGSKLISPERNTDSGESALKRRRRSSDWIPPSESLARLENIPLELFNIIYTDAPLRELIKLRKVNRSFKQYVDDGEFWRALILRDFPFEKGEGYIPLAPLSTRKYQVPLTVQNVSRANARRLFLNAMALTAGTMRDVLLFVETTLHYINIDHDARSSKPWITLNIGDSHKVCWSLRVGSSDDWPSWKLKIVQGASITPEQLFVLCGQDRGCTQAYSDVLSLYEDAGRPWFHPNRAHRLLLKFFRELLLKTDYLGISLEIDFNAIAMSFTLHLLLGSPRLVGMSAGDNNNATSVEELRASSVTKLVVSPALAGLMVVNVVVNNNDRSRKNVLLSWL